jgi:CRISPR-associated endonuclease Cas1
MQHEGTSADNPPLRISLGGVLVVEGFSAALSVENSHLKVRSGTGRRIAEGTFSRVTSPRLRRVVVIAGPAGYLSIPAVRWVRDVGADLVVLAPDGDVMLAPGRTSPDDARLRRAQALAAGSDLGLRISRQLITAKIAGQHRVVASRFPEAPAHCVTTLVDQVAEAERAPTIEELRQIEALASALYFSAWKGLRPRWARRDEARIPEHWRRFTTRGSPLANGPRMSADPLNSMVNLASALLEVEAILSLRALGLDSGIAFGLHADQRARASAADDLMEPARPAAEELVLDLLGGRVLSRRDFAESPNGHVKLMPVLAKSLVEAWTPELSQAVAPWAEQVAMEIAKAAGINNLPTKLTETNRSAGRDPHRKAAQRARTRTRVVEHMVPPRCRECGEILLRRTRTLCDACAFEHRVGSVQQAGRANLSKMRAQRETDPARTPEARAKLGSTQAKRAKERAEWDRNHPGETPDPAIFRAEILSGLAGIPVARIARETGLSTVQSWYIRRGDRIPHPRFWAALAGLRSDSSSDERAHRPPKRLGVAL